MAEEIEVLSYPAQQVGITVCSKGFLVRGNQYGSDELRAFSTPEGLIEWLARELGAGPIVWYVTLEIWAKEAGITADDLIPLPDQSINPQGYAGVLYQNSMFILGRLIDMELERLKPKPPPEPRPKKPKKAKEEKGEKEGVVAQEQTVATTGP